MTMMIYLDKMNQLVLEQEERLIMRIGNVYFVKNVMKKNFRTKGLKNKDNAR